MRQFINCAVRHYTLLEEVPCRGLLIFLNLLLLSGCSPTHHQYYPFEMEVVEVDGYTLDVSISPKSREEHEEDSFRRKPYHLTFHFIAPGEQDKCAVTADFRYQQTVFETVVSATIDSQHVNLKQHPTLPDRPPEVRHAIQYIYPDPSALILFANVSLGQGCINEGKTVAFQVEAGGTYIDERSFFEI